MIKIVSLSAALLACASYASELPELPFQQSNSPHKLFIASENVQQGFDSWKIDGGYSYNVFDKVDLYIGARVDQSNLSNELGFLSGVSYQVTPRVSLKSTLHSHSDDPLAKNSDESTISAEVSSRLQLTENLDVHATLDYQEWQQGVEVGLGFRF